MVISEENHKPRLNKNKDGDPYSAASHSAEDIEQSTTPDLPEFIDRERIGPHTPEGECIENNNSNKKAKASAKRRNRRNKLKLLRSETLSFTEDPSTSTNNNINQPNSKPQTSEDKGTQVDKDTEENNIPEGYDPEGATTLRPLHIKMSDIKTREEILAARQAKKQSKLKGGRGKESIETAGKLADTKKVVPEQVVSKPVELQQVASNSFQPQVVSKPVEPQQVASKPVEPLQVGSIPIEADPPSQEPQANLPRSKDEVDKACLKVKSISIDDDKSKDLIKAERAAKKAAKQAKKQGAGETEVPKVETPVAIDQGASKPVNEDMTVKDVVETLKEIVTVAKDIKDVTEKVSAIDLSGKKPQSQQPIKDKSEEGGKSKAVLKAERRAKQEAQRAAKQAAVEQKDAAKPKTEVKATPDRSTPSKDDKAPKQKSAEKSKPKSQSSHRVNWFQHLYKEQDKEPLKSIAINSHLHPAIIKLGVQLASRVVAGSNARCIALLDALKKMVRDYTLPAKTEFVRGLESHLASSLVFLWAMRPPSASQTNAVKFFRYHLTQLPNNVDEFDAKKTLQEEIDRYIREQIDMAGEAISIAVRNKISNGDTILTYGCSSLIERILREAWSAGVHFHTIVVGNRVHGAAAQMLRRLTAHGLPCTYVDITSLSCVMNTVNKVILGAGALLVNGSVLGAVGTAQVALAARARNVPVLVACETHKFSERVQTDAFVYNEIGDPDELIDKSDDNSPLKDWRSNQNLTPLNLTYDVTPASLVTAVVTELAILPCTSAPVVLRFKLSEYGV